jgi:prephenate dehydrogenase
MFVGSHPIAGSDKQGWEHAQADLFVDRLCLLTPTAGTDASRMQQVARFWRAVGMRTRTCDPDEHDERLATTSHLPHAIAAALVATLTDAQAPLIGKGFLDTTRIAGGDATIWTPIFIENSAALLEAIDSFRLHLEDLREAIDDRDAKFLTELLTDAAERRRAIGQRDVAESAERSSDEAGGSR